MPTHTILHDVIALNHDVIICGFESEADVKAVAEIVEDGNRKLHDLVSNDGVGKRQGHEERLEGFDLSGS